MDTRPPVRQAPSTVPMENGGKGPLCAKLTVKHISPALQAKPGHTAPLITLLSLISFQWDLRQENNRLSFRGHPNSSTLAPVLSLSQVRKLLFQLREP